jgi:hypothetical protein
MADLEKPPPSADSENSPDNITSHGNGPKDLRNDSLGPSQLTTSVSWKSKTGSQLSRCRSYVDGYSGYFSNRDDENEDVEPSNGDGGPEGKDFEVKFKENDPMNPRNMSTVRKWIVVFTLAFGSLCVTCVSSLYTTTYEQIDVEFHCSTLVSTLGLALFVWGLGLSPMVLGPISEFYGRRPVYIGAYLFFTIWLIPCGKYVLLLSQYSLLTTLDVSCSKEHRYNACFALLGRLGW